MCSSAAGIKQHGNKLLLNYPFRNWIRLCSPDAETSPVPMYSSAAFAVSTSLAFTRWILFCGEQRQVADRHLRHVHGQAAACVAWQM